MRNKYAFICSILQLHKKKAIRSTMRKKGRIKGLGEESNTLSDPRDHSRNFAFEKLYKNLRIDS
jgi:hypothetical protein